MKYNDILDVFNDDANDYEDDLTNNIATMDNIADGDYWQTIIREYRNNTTTAYEAEDAFTIEYIKRMRKLFTYVVNIPIRVKKGNVPKYRLLFGTNHDHGLFLMVDEMNKAWKKLIEESRNGQLEFDFPDMEGINGFKFEDDAIVILKKNDSKIFMKKIVIEMIEKYGITFSISEYRQKFKDMDGKQIKITRDPEFTKNGRKATSMNWDDYTIFLELL